MNAPSLQLVRIEIENMRKTRGDVGRKVHIVIPEFYACAGEFVAIVGSNGSGKSTFLDLLGLVDTPDSIDKHTFCNEACELFSLACLKNTEVSKIRRKYFAYILQNGGLLEFLTVKQNIELVQRLKGTGSGNMEDIARRLGIHDVLNQRPGQLSGGQRQKAAIARALIQTPQLILADEPTSAMDNLSATALMESFKEINANVGASLIVVTHDFTLVEKWADRFYAFFVEESAPGIIVSTLRECQLPTNTSKV